MRDFLQVVFKLDKYKTEEAEQADSEQQKLRLGGEKYFATCVGIGYKNLSKVVL